MLFRLRYAVVALALVCVSWFGWSMYAHFFDKAHPSLSLSGLDDQGCYGGEILCKVAASKKGTLSVYLDKKPLLSNHWLNLREREHPFTIPSKTIGNGKHHLEIVLSDGSYNKNQTKIEREFYVDNVPLQAAFVRPESDYKVFQGRTLHIQFQVNKEIKEATVHALAADFQGYPESKNSSVWECHIPISCEEAPNEYLLSVDIVDKVGNVVTLENKFQVVQYPFKKQNLHVSAEKVAEEKEKGEDTALLEERILHLIAQSPREKLWRGPFVNPIDVARVTCDFGTIRTTQEKGRYMHKGVDLINAPKSVVWAPQSGIVVHKERYAFTGNTVIIDHGYGVLSLFFHLDSFADICEGQKVAQGNPIGTLGKTGYATGYHLHWEMRINNVHVDPMQWTKNSF